MNSKISSVTHHDHSGFRALTLGVNEGVGSHLSVLARLRRGAPKDSRALADRSDNK